ncbi:MAG: T9SS type A sorting domain-containing protein [Saprospiraceae bacterium]|nr:T9SS type A sorting domain-containing protein [Saprospiraceae bacterium]
MKLTTLTLILLLPLGLSAQFTFEKRVTNSAGNSYTSFNNANVMAANGDVVHLVYTDERGLEGEVYYQRSIDGGISWQMAVQLTTDNGSFSGYPAIAVWNNEVHVAWADQRSGHDDIYYRKSYDGGTSWFDETRITNDPADSGFPCLSTSGPVVHLVWTDTRFEDEEIYYCHSLNAGQSWGDQMRLTNDGGNSINASVSSSANDVHVVWQDNRNGNDEIYYKRSTDGGLSWGADLRMTNNPFKSNFPSAVAMGKTIIIVWSDLREGNAEIFGLRSVDNGDTWSEDIRLTNSPRESLQPKIAMEGAFAFLTWHELHDGFANWEVESRFSTDGGFAWTPRRQLSAEEGFSGNSTVCVENLLVMVAWTESRFGDTEILSRRNPTGNPLHSTHTLDWAYSIGATGSSAATDMVLDAEGNIFLTGNFQNSVYFDPGIDLHILSSAGDDDIFISKTSPSGEVFWAKRIGGPGMDHANSIAMDREGNVILTGSFHGTADFDPGPNVFPLSAGVDGDAYITKLDENGNFLWAIQITGDGFNEIRSVKTDATNNIFVTGLFEETADFDPTDGVYLQTSRGLEDIFLAKYTPEGQLIWVHGMGGPGADAGRGVTVTLTGQVWMAGHFSESVDFNPKPDEATLTAQGLDDIFVATYTGQGDYIRSLRIGGNENEEVNGIHMDAPGNILLTGMFRGNVDFNPSTFTTFLASQGGDDGFVVKLSPSGIFVWARSFGGEDNDKGIDISTDHQGNILVSGYFRGYADFYSGIADSWAQTSGEEDLFVLSLNANGDFGRMDQISGQGSDAASAIAHYKTTRYYIAGSFTQKIDADPSADVFPLNSNGDDDFLLASINVCPAVYSFFEATACDSLISPDGEAVWTSTGTYLDTLSSSIGCDSIITVVLTINDYDETHVTNASCDSYTTPNGQHTWTQSGEYVESLTNTDGCDSLIIYHLTIYLSSETTDTRTECDQYEDPLGNVYASSGSFLYTIPDMHGCDSVISLELTIVHHSETERTETTCDSLVTPGGVLTASGVYTQIFSGTNGCDSIVNLHLTIIHSSSGSEAVETCFSYTTPDGEETFEDSGIYTFVVPNAAGCDSVVTLDLLIAGPDNSITISDHSLSAQQDSAAYQWMDCILNTLIPDSVGQAYFPTRSGSYAVIVTLNGCVDTSDCVELILVSSNEPDSQSGIRLYPNPTQGDILIALSTLRENVQMEITDVYGRQLELITFQHVHSIPFSFHFPQGIYLFYILADGQRKVIQVVKM